jgi:hypothetical protein
VVTKVSGHEEHDDVGHDGHEDVLATPFVAYPIFVFVVADW